MINKKDFMEFHQHEEIKEFVVSDSLTVTDDSARRSIIKSIGIEPREIGNLDKKERDKILHKLKREYSIRQLERITGISRGIIMKS